MFDKKLWEQAQQLARQKYSELYDENWDELDKYEREDCVWLEYEKLLKEKENNVMSTKLVCPNCGTEMKLPEKSEIVTGVTLSKETGGTHVLQADVIKNNNLNDTKLKDEEKEIMHNSRESRMNTLNNAGVDTSKYFDVQIPGGGTVKMKMENGVPVIVPQAVDSMQRFKEEIQDEILNQIIEDGYVRNTKLHRRWVMAQMFRMLNYEGYRMNRNCSDSGYDACLRNSYGYMYQFSMMLEEIRVLSKLEDRDKESFNERSHFFTKNVVIATCTDYLEKLKADIETQKSKNCKGVPYKRVKGQNIFVADLEKKIYQPIRRKIWAIERARNYKEIYKELKKFNDNMIKLRWDTPKCKMWIDAFKGSGAYYTLKNLTMYHGCKIIDEKINCYSPYQVPRTVTEYEAGVEATNFIKSKLDEYRGEGWRYMAMLKKCIADNGFSFEQKMKEIYNK